MHSGGDSTDTSADETAPDRDAWPDVDRRRSDRRNAPTKPWNPGWSPLRRERGRRTDDHSSYVDRYTRRDVVLLLTVFLLNVGDAFFTMLWLERGGREANPVMDFFLDIGPGAFLLQKCLVVGFWLVVLLVHKNFRFARIGLYASLVVYGLLMIVHFGIIAFDVEPPRAEVTSRPRRVLERARSAATSVPHASHALPVRTAPEVAPPLRTGGRSASE